MSIFSRARDIISSNVNAMLDKAENPEKLIKLIVREMEDTLIEVKASCAGAMAAKRKTRRELDLVQAREAEWERRARLALAKGRDDLAREALIERRRYADRGAALQGELNQCDALLEQYRGDIAQLEEKLEKVLEKERVLVQRHVHAQQKIRAQREIRRFDTSDALARFENFEARIDRLETEGDLVNFGRRPSLEDEFARLEGNDEIDQELEALRASLAPPRAE
jgi:phage shock protein A